MVSVVGFFGRQYILSAHGFTARLKSSNFIFQEVNGKRPSFHPEPIPHIARLNGSGWRDSQSWVANVFRLIFVRQNERLQQEHQRK
jgi:hypothetical protein